eukprot:GHRR01027808.1.p1 GENE.GHRR01027808.1~~GHRR01027808.1.p1  ORF type:complete len:126 (-),score=22.52 GHRR01027808.1:173-550(-)
MWHMPVLAPLLCTAASPTPSPFAVKINSVDMRWTCMDSNDCVCKYCTVMPSCMTHIPVNSTHGQHSAFKRCYKPAKPHLCLCFGLAKQVTNTPWGERVTFLFDPAGDVGPKALHVSPFMNMQNTW